MIGCHFRLVQHGLGKEQTIRISDQYVYCICKNRRRHLQTMMAGGTLFPMDQTKFTHQNLLWDVTQ